MMAKQAVASYRRRGAHAAARKHATPFVGEKRVPEPAVGGRVPHSGGIGGWVGGLRSRHVDVRFGLMDFGPVDFLALMRLARI